MLGFRQLEKRRREYKLKRIFLTRQGGMTYKATHFKDGPIWMEKMLCKWGVLVPTLCQPLFLLEVGQHANGYYKSG